MDWHRFLGQLRQPDFPIRPRALKMSLRGVSQAITATVMAFRGRTPKANNAGTCVVPREGWGSNVIPRESVL